MSSTDSCFFALVADYIYCTVSCNRAQIIWHLKTTVCNCLIDFVRPIIYIYIYLYIYTCVIFHSTLIYKSIICISRMFFAWMGSVVFFFLNYIYTHIYMKNNIYIYISCYNLFVVIYFSLLSRNSWYVFCWLRGCKICIYIYTWCSKKRTPNTLFLTQSNRFNYCIYIYIDIKNYIQTICFFMFKPRCFLKTAFKHYIFGFTFF